ncbi:MAG: FAD-dependent thymidylate synthase [Firmicutes bacterium]|nr:FAD-dependent thymidylate synthase [Bacillota bacterium]
MDVPKVLNNGYVELIESFGHDQAVIRNARRCWRSESKGESSDRNLIRHLITAGHKSPFEATVFTFDVKAPLFVARQWFRHRIASYNEESLRYCIALRDYYIPDGLTGEQLDQWKKHHESCFDFYDELVHNQGLKKEQARSVLPIGIYTKFYWTVNGSSLMNFLHLRLDKAAQFEIREYARVILELVKEKAPMCFEEFEREVINKRA